MASLFVLLSRWLCSAVSLSFSRSAYLIPPLPDSFINKQCKEMFFSEVGMSSIWNLHFKKRKRWSLQLKGRQIDYTLVGMFPLQSQFLNTKTETPGLQTSRGKGTDCQCYLQPRLHHPNYVKRPRIQLKMPSAEFSCWRRAPCSGIRAMAKCGSWEQKVPCWEWIGTRWC